MPAEPGSVRLFSPLHSLEPGLTDQGVVVLANHAQYGMTGDSIYTRALQEGCSGIRIPGIAISTQAEQQRLVFAGLQQGSEVRGALWYAVRRDAGLPARPAKAPVTACEQRAAQTEQWLIIL